MTRVSEIIRVRRELLKGNKVTTNSKVLHRLFKGVTYSTLVSPDLFVKINLLQTNMMYDCEIWLEKRKQ